MMFRSLLMLSGSMVALQAALSSLAKELAAGETQALAFDFTDDFWQADTGHYGSAWVKDTGTPANNYNSHPYGLLTYSAPSAKWVMGPAGLLVESTGKLPFEWDSSGNLLGILVEEARTNLCTYSEKFDNAAWSTTEITVAADSTTAPDGTTTADKVTPSTGTNYHRINNAAAVAADTTGTLSCFIKPNGYTQVALRENSSTGAAAVFDLTGSGSVDGTHAPGGTTINSATVTALPNGWYRCAFSYTKGGSSSSSLGIYVIDGSWTSGDPHSVTYAGDGTSGCYVWGAQHEVGAFPTSYIPTIGSTVTRAADNISLATSAFPYSTSVGTVFAQASSRFSAGTSPASAIDSNGRWLYVGNAGEVRSYDGVNITQAASTISDGAVFKAAAALGSGSSSITQNGATADTGTFDNTMGTGTYYIGSGYTAAYMNGHIKRLMHLPRKMSAAEIQTLTT